MTEVGKIPEQSHPFGLMKTIEFEAEGLTFEVALLGLGGDHRIPNTILEYSVGKGKKRERFFMLMSTDDDERITLVHTLERKDSIAERAWAAAYKARRLPGASVVLGWSYKRSSPCIVCTFEESVQPS